MARRKRRTSGRQRRSLVLIAAAYVAAALLLAGSGYAVADAIGWGSTVRIAIAWVITMAVQIVFVLRAEPEDRGMDLSSRWAVVAALGLAIALPSAVAGLVHGVIDGDTAVARCPGGTGKFPARGAVVNGHGPEVHSSASVTSQVTRIVPTDCKLAFVGYCIGDVVFDATHPEVPDSRWFILPDGQGLIPSGQTVGNPPTGMRPVPCKGSVPPPDRVVIREAVLHRSGRYMRLAGTSPRAAFVGFAMQLRDGRWRRLGWDRGPEDSNSFGAVIDPAARGRPLIAAVACVAVENPTPVLKTALATSGEVAPVRQPFRVREPVGKKPTVVACKAGTKLPK